MSVLAAALVTFFSLALLFLHVKERRTMKKIVSFALVFDVVVHGTIIYIFLGTSTLGIMQAELAAIFFTVAIRTYRFFIGYTHLSLRRERKGWKAIFDYIFPCVTWVNVPGYRFPSIRSFLGV